MNERRMLRLRRDVLTELGDETLATVAGAEAAVTIHQTWCVLCITYATCPETCTGVTFRC